MTSNMNQAIEQRVTALENVVHSNGRLLLAALSYVSLSVCFNRCRDYAMTIPGPLEDAGLEVLISLGEIVGFLSVAIYLYLLKPGAPGRDLNVHVITLHASFVAGSLALMLPLGGNPNAVGAFAAGASYAGALTMLLKNISVLPTRHMVIVVASGFFSTFALAPYVGDLGTTASVFTVLIASSVSCAGALAMGASLPAAERGAYVPSWRLMAFALVTPLVFGFCNAQLTGTFSQFTLKVGYAIPSSIILAYAIFLRDRFTLLAVHWIMFPLAIVGCTSALLLDVPGNVAKTLVSANLGGIYILSYMLVRMRSHDSSTDPAAAYALLNGLIVIVSQISRLIYPRVAALIEPEIVAMVLILAIVLVYGIFILQPDGSTGQSIYVTLHQDPGDNSVPAIARRYGLSERETTVLALMVEQRSATQIADELCISTAAVRTHMSRIYAKMGVHSRKEFDASVNTR